jgi:hypothetical protein
MVARFGVTGDTAWASRNIGQNKKASPLKSFFPTVKTLPNARRTCMSKGRYCFVSAFSVSLRH